MSKPRDKKHQLDDSQYPILCQICLGDNPYMRMMVDKYGQECKVCNRPFTTYRWCPGKGMRYKKTEICQICSRAKNVCQTCLLDLKYNLPVQARDQLLQITSEQIPRSDVNREYYAQILEKKYDKKGQDQEQEVLAIQSEPGPSTSDIGKDPSPGAKIVAKLARRTPYYKRNLPHICSFWVKGECKRGDECPYRHEMPTDPDNPLSKQNIKDRYHGTRDPVAQRILAKAAEADRQERASKEPTEFVE